MHGATIKIINAANVFIVEIYKVLYLKGFI
jgi:hypothetical protein